MHPVAALQAGDTGALASAALAAILLLLAAQTLALVGLRLSDAAEAGIRRISGRPPVHGRGFDTSSAAAAGADLLWSRTCLAPGLALFALVGAGRLGIPVPSLDTVAALASGQPALLAGAPVLAGVSVLVAHLRPGRLVATLSGVSGWALAAMAAVSSGRPETALALAVVFLLARAAATAFIRPIRILGGAGIAWSIALLAALFATTIASYWAAPVVLVLARLRPAPGISLLKIGRARAREIESGGVTHPVCHALDLVSGMRRPA